MSDVYAPPESELLGTSSGGPPPTQNNGVYPADVGQLFSRSWEVMQPMLVPCALGAMSVFAIHFAINMPMTVLNGVLQGVVQSTSDETMQLLGGVLMVGIQLVGVLLGQVTATFMALGMARGSSKLVRTGEVEVSDFLPFEPALLLRGLGGQLLYGLIVLLGSCALIVPGIMAAIGLIFWPYAMVVEGHGPVNALKRSWQLSTGSKLHLFLFGVALTALGVFVMPLTLCMGFLVLMPFMYTAYALFFEGARAALPELVD
ncbi:MAG: hypothetical protein CL927_13925 [Deltaproteobacteria bacterium]|nr:hypothetical protein [Deltaproteobacteria bacterium]